MGAAGISAGADQAGADLKLWRADRAAGSAGGAGSGGLADQAAELLRRKASTVSKALEACGRKLDGTGPACQPPGQPGDRCRQVAAVGTVGRTHCPRLGALYGCMYYGMLRLSEAASLCWTSASCLVRIGGVLEFSEISSAAGRDWTDDGQVHEASRPKGGPRDAIRRVPILPVLVKMIREHFELFGTARDGRLF